MVILQQLHGNTTEPHAGTTARGVQDIGTRGEQIDVRQPAAEARLLGKKPLGNLAV